MKICFISNSVTMFTGFGQQTRILSKELEKLGHEIFNLCETRLDEDTPWITEIPFASFSPESYDRELRRIKPDVVIVLDGYPRSFRACDLAYSGLCKFFIWFPYESIVPVNSHVDKFRNAPPGSIVFTSEFTQKSWEPHVKGDVIPHCIDIDLLSEPRDIKNADMLRSRIGLRDYTIVNVNRNEVRKRWDNFFKLIRQLVDQNYKNREFDVLVHSNKTGYYDFKQLNDYYSLHDYIKISDFEFVKGLSNADFRDLMGSMSLRIDTSSSEGFGLTVADFAAMKVPQWVGNHTCMSEILGKDHVKFDVTGEFVAHNKCIYSELNLEPLSVTHEMTEAAFRNVDTKFHPAVVADKWLTKIESYEAPTNKKWGFNETERMGQTFLSAATFCKAAGKTVTEFNTYDDKFINCCLYLGLEVTGLLLTNPINLSERIKFNCTKFDNSVIKTDVTVITDSFCPSNVLDSEWVLIRGDLKLPPIYKRRPELEQAMVARSPSFKHKIYSKNTDVNPLG